MGRILSTTYHDTVEKVTNFYNELVNNPFYTLNDKKPTICTYYNINKDYSSLDPGSKLQMSNLGDQSPIRFNRIYDFILYGFPKIELNMENGEFGLEAERIEGECYILPNTIIPTEGDYFEISHIKDSSWLFLVKDVQKDTLDNGSNVYKINYKLDQLDRNNILQNIINNFRLIDYKEGTNIARVVRCEDYDIAKLMDNHIVGLTKYYMDLFYNDKVQTFIYMDLTDYRVYDQFMIEFLIRNKILDNGEDYVYVAHHIKVPKTFNIDYGETFFRVFEKKDRDRILTCKRSSYIEQISSYGTTFWGRYEDYYRTIYEDTFVGYNSNSISDEIVYNIAEKNIVTYEPEANTRSTLWKNILTKYFYDEDITLEELESLEEIEFVSSKEAFYIIPLLIFCLGKFIENTLK